MSHPAITEDERRAIIAKLIQEMRECGSWAGETHVNKHAFYLQDLLKCDLGLRFHLHWFGPYSPSLRDELRVMLREGILGTDEFRDYKPKLKITESGKVVAGRARRWEKQIRWIARQLGGKSAGALEGPSTARLLRSQNEWWSRDPWDDEALAREIYRLKNHIPVERARAAIRELDELEAAAKDEHVILEAS